MQDYPQILQNTLINQSEVSQVSIGRKLPLFLISRWHKKYISTLTDQVGQ